MTLRNRSVSWGEPPWQLDFQPGKRQLPAEVDTAIIGGGFTGLAAAAWLRRLAPEEIVAVFEASSLGSGASGRTGGIALGETAAGDLPGLGDVLHGFGSILRELQVDCQLTLSGVWEIARSKARPESPIVWQDSGTLRVANEVPGGTVDAGKLLSGLARAAERLGAILCEFTPVRRVQFGEPIRLGLPQGEVRARRVLFATNAQSLELNALVGCAQPKFTLATATAPLTAEQLEAIGLGQGKPFYTLDLPYLWGRLLGNNRVVFGGGLVDLRDGAELMSLDIGSGRAVELLRRLERRVRGLHAALRSVEFTHRWGGPILFGSTFRPVFSRHPSSSHALVLGAYSGQGVTLSVYLGCWAAEALTRQRDLPAWGALSG